ncbi:DUF1599 domain-containing protein [Alloprevotella sp. OH1205_COT-284]|uniref:DUF1599 domain-containing protein n=1 Tax=Alloprevotella sp. OH1205_COT-284 TaxID=2491043 RepID=UPI000F5F9D9A|nr:DUF1599 domain-containing protein [Alloprevotella sp. OH1205_COT-284]RRD76312.1 DUF1599 domain-containing protein [Alloprevotella sp. OH1205_COT-284]
MTTQQEFEKAMSLCRELFFMKMHDYGTAWRILRPESLTDQIYIKANRIRSLQTKGVSLVGEGIIPEFIGIVNYAIMGLIQLELGASDGTDESDLNDPGVIIHYDKYATEALELMLRKNHDYDEAWRAMRVSSYADLILMKVFRTKQIEDLEGETLVSEGIAANYMDMLNYSVFALIKLVVEKGQETTLHSDET